MTIIIATKDAIYTDSQNTLGDTTRSYVKADYAVVKGKPCIVAGTGYTWRVNVLKGWFISGMEGPLPAGNEDQSASLIVLSENQLLAFFNHQYPCLLEDFTYPYTFGSGEEFALGALYAGKTPREAVELTIKGILSCGGEVQEYTLEQAKILHDWQRANKRIEPSG